MKPPQETHSGWSVLRLGFRPFYLAGALLAALLVPVWVAVFLGGLKLPPAAPGVMWHAHEMLFGFAVAVIVGFLLTAGKAWTGLATPRGPLLGVLVLLWLAARIASLVAPGPVYAVLDVLLLPLVAAILVRILLRSRNYRNLPLALILLLLTAANAVFHLSVANVLPLAPMQALHAGLALIVMIQCVMAGRVIPGFTMSATPGLKLDLNPRLDGAALAATALGLAWWVLGAPGWPGFVLLTVAAALHLLRQWRWWPWLTRKRPVLWILHAAYAWIALGLGLLALAQMGWVPISAGVHALGVGATGGLIIGMITRTARGHTGRPIQASRTEVWAYTLVMAAAVLRVLLPLLLPQWLGVALVAAAAAWTCAFVLYLVVYTPWLLRARLDGRDG